jgi:hypothetical protein
MKMDTSLLARCLRFAALAAVLPGVRLIAQTGAAAATRVVAPFAVKPAIGLLFAENDAFTGDFLGKAKPAEFLEDDSTTATSTAVAPLHMKYIPAGETAQPITAHDKVELGLEDLVTPFGVASMFLVSGYEQLLNGEPNYGTDRGAFGERLGAAALRENTQDIFTDAVFAPLLHEDPRYYTLGPGHSIVHRTLYAITRPLITKGDNGRATVNGALMSGYGAAAALSYTYYPGVNQNLHDTVATFGGSIGGAAIGFVVREFSGDILEGLHRKRKF